MNISANDLLLYAVTDSRWVGEESLAMQVEKTILAGVTTVQYREKSLDSTEFLAEAKEIQGVCKKHHIPFIVNDDVDVCVALDATGVHIGQGDENAKIVRQKIGTDKILGVSVRNARQAKLAEKDGADYLGVGAVFGTSTKLDAADVSFETLKEITQAVNIPVIAIGGITLENVVKLGGSGIVGVAVVSSIFAQKDIVSATKKLRKECETLFFEGKA